MLILENSTSADTKNLLQNLTHWVEAHTILLLSLFTVLGLVLSFRGLSTSALMTKIQSDDPWMIATHLYQGQGYTACSPEYFPLCNSKNNATAEREPIPVIMFLGAMEIVNTPVAGFLLEVLLYISVLYILYFSLRNESRILALGTGLLWIVSIPVVDEIGNGSGDIEAAFWVAAAMYFFQKARRTRRWIYWALAGIFLGLSALSRTIIFGVALGLAFALLFEQGLGTFRSRIRQMMTLLLAFGLVLSPWIIRNELVFGSPIFTSTLTGYNVYRQNYILSEPDYSLHYVGAQEAAKALHSLLARNPDLRGNMNEAQMQSVYLHAGLKIISAHPLAYLGLSAYRFFALWFNSSVKASYGKHTDLTDVFMIIEQLLLLSAALIGALRFHHKLWPYALAIILTTAAYMLVDAQVRYLIEVMPLIVTLAGWGLFASKGQVPSG